MLNPNYDRTESESQHHGANSNENSVAVIMGDNTGKHCHEPNNDQDRNKTAWYKLITVLCMCFCFMIAEVIGGIIAGSIAIQTDAAHMASDIAGYFFSILAIYISGKSKRILRNLLTLNPFSKKTIFCTEPTKKMSFGFFRSEVLGVTNLH